MSVCKVSVINRGKNMLATLAQGFLLTLYLCSGIAALITRWMADVQDNNHRRSSSTIGTINVVSSSICLFMCFLTVSYVVWAHLSMRSENKELWYKSITVETSPEAAEIEVYHQQNRLLPDAQRYEQGLDFANKMKLIKNLTLANTLLVFLVHQLSLDMTVQHLSLTLALLSGCMAILPYTMSLPRWFKPTAEGIMPELQPILQHQEPQVPHSQHPNERPLVYEGSQDASIAVL